MPLPTRWPPPFDEALTSCVDLPFHSIDGSARSFISSFNAVASQYLLLGFLAAGGPSRRRAHDRYRVRNLAPDQPISDVRVPRVILHSVTLPLLSFLSPPSSSGFHTLGSLPLSQTPSRFSSRRSSISPTPHYSLVHHLPFSLPCHFLKFRTTPTKARSGTLFRAPLILSTRRSRLPSATDMSIPQNTN